MSNAIKALQAKRLAEQAAQAAQTTTPDSSEEAEKAPELAAPTEDCYKVIRLHQLVLASGAKVSPVNGYYVAQSQEEYELLEYYADKPGLLERVAGVKTKK